MFFAKTHIVASMILITLLFTTISFSKPPTSVPIPGQVPEPVKRDPNQTAVTVNGQVIKESAITAFFDKNVRDKMAAQGRTPEQIDQSRGFFRQQILDKMIDDILFEKELKKTKVTVTDADLKQFVEKALQEQLDKMSMNKDQFNEMLKERNNSYDKIVAEAVNDPELCKHLQQEKLMEKSKAGELKVTEKEIEDAYNQNKTKYEKPEMVRASHILFNTKEAKTEEEKTAARKQAEDVLAQTKKPGADFVALAQEHSSCPSKAKGGDLNFFPRTGAMVEPFAAAAYALKVGETSDIVETQFGYHIIKVTDRKPAENKTLDQVKDSIRDDLTQQKKQTLMQTYVKELRDNAKIIYPQEPSTAPATKTDN